MSTYLANLFEKCNANKPPRCMKKMSVSNVLIKGVIGAAVIITIICIAYFSAGVFMRAISNGRVSQIEDIDYVDNDCSKITTAKGHRLNSEECNKARARRDLSTIGLFLYDGGDFAAAAVAFLYSVVMRNLFIALIVTLLFFGTTFYHFQRICSIAYSVLPKQKEI